MSYTKREDITLDSGELVVQLGGSGDLVAVQCPVSRDPLYNQPIYEARARWIDEKGTARQDGSGREVVTILVHQSNADQVAALTSPVIVKECLLLVLGEALTQDPANEDLTIIPWGPMQVAQCSIRGAIAAASVTAPAASDVL